MVEDTPLREKSLAKLNSEYDHLSEMYNSLKNKKSEAEIAVSMERKRLEGEGKQGTSEEKEKKMEMASETLTFLSNELNTVEKRLKEKEEERRKYREKYMGGLPEQLETNMQILEGLRQLLDQYNSNLRDAENRKLAILRDI